MGLIQRILDFLFGKGKPKAAPGKADVAGAEKIVSAALAAEDRELVKLSSARFAEIKHLLSRLSKGADYLEKQKIDLSSGNEAFRRIVSTSQKNLGRQLRGLSQKLSPPQHITPEAVREYVKRALPSVANDLMPYWKNVALTKLLLKDEVKELGHNLKELAMVLEALEKAAFSERGSKLARLSSLSTELAAKASAGKELEAAISSLKPALEESQAEAISLEAAIEEKQKSPPAIELTGLKSRLRELESAKGQVVSRLNSSLAPLEKVLKRAASLAETEALSVHEKEILNLLLSNPEAAIIADPKGDTAKTILTKASSMVQTGSISLKESEKTRRLEALSTMLSKDFFTEYFWEMNKAQAEIAQVQKQITATTVSGELDVLAKKLSSAKSAAENKTAELEATEKELAKNRAEHNHLLAEFKGLFNTCFDGQHELAA